MIKKIIYLVLAFVLGLGALSLGGCKENFGEIKYLKDAYEAGWITKEDLIDIACIYNEKKEAEKINDQIEINIKRAYREQLHGGTRLEEINVSRYCGTYHGCVVAEVSDFSCIKDILIIDEYEIDGVIFNQFWTLSVWCENID